MVTMPPLGLSVSPTKNAASSLARNATVAGDLLGRPKRPSGVRSRSAVAQRVARHADVGVSMKPGATALTRIALHDQLLGDGAREAEDRRAFAAE